MLDLDTLDQERTRWVELQGPLRGVEVQVKHAAPRDIERFRQRLVRNGILRQNREGAHSINTGREDDFFKAFAEFYVLDWRGDVRPEGTPYSADLMGRLLARSVNAFQQIGSAISDEADFFSGNGTE